MWHSFSPTLMAGMQPRIHTGRVKLFVIHFLYLLTQAPLK